VPPFLKIRQVGDPVLRQRAQPISLEELATPRIQDLIAFMRETMRDAPGVGLAAPQIGESLQLVVIEDPPNLQAGLSPELLAERERNAVPFHVLVNPVLTVVGDEHVDAFEGCLSVSGFVMGVRRARRVRVEAMNERGQRMLIEAGGWYARILQHECDHLRGALCIDRADLRTLAASELQGRYWRGLTPQGVRDAQPPGELTWAHVPQPAEEDGG
jgi:peptide deformylase